jgi:hypothetical protein
LKAPRAFPVVGWREWLSLPELGIARIKAKVDTGARTSALHAFDVEPFEVEGEPWVRFRVHPGQRDAVTTVEAAAPLVDEREVRSSSGKATFRPVVRARAVLGEHDWPIEITLVRRDLMGFRMLLGRQAVRDRFLVDAGRSFRLGSREAGTRRRGGRP